MKSASGLTPPPPPQDVRTLFRPTCAFPDDGVEFRTEQGLGVVEDELHHHRLDADLHKRRRAAEAGRLNLSGPGTQSENIATYLATPEPLGSDPVRSHCTAPACKGHLRRFGAQTMARFLVCMLVVELKVARWARCLMRYSRVLDFDKRLYLVRVNVIYRQ